MSKRYKSCIAVAAITIVIASVITYVSISGIMKERAELKEQQALFKAREKEFEEMHTAAESLIQAFDRANEVLGVILGLPEEE